MNSFSAKGQILLAVGALTAYLVLFAALALVDLIQERRLQKKLGKHYEGPLAD